MIKGAPDVIINRCSSYVSLSGKVMALDPSMRSSFERVKDSYSSEGKRCLLLARKVIAGDTIVAKQGTGDYETAILEHAKTDLVLVGLVAIVDPLRPEIPDVVGTLRGAGIRINMVRTIRAGIFVTALIHQRSRVTLLSLLSPLLAKLAL